MVPEARPEKTHFPGARVGKHANRIVIPFAMFVMLLFAGCAGSEAAPPATRDPLVAAGQALFQRHCASCHPLEPDTVIVGPSLAGVAGRAGERMPGFDARQYIQSSILHPDAYLVEGFENLMPSTLAKELTGEELDTLTAYLLTLE